MLKAEPEEKLNIRCETGNISAQDINKRYTAISGLLSTNTFSLRFCLEL